VAGPQARTAGFIYTAQQQFLQVGSIARTLISDPIRNYDPAVVLALQYPIRNYDPAVESKAI
jgi:hypothetical protein